MPTPTMQVKFTQADTDAIIAMAHAHSQADSAHDKAMNRLEDERYEYGIDVGDSRYM